jgi:hypothetical protein
LKYWTTVKAWGGLLAAAGAVLVMLALPAGASAAPKAHPRHVEVIPPSVAGRVELGKQHGYRVSVAFSEPDVAILTVSRFRGARLSTEETKYGAHLLGSLSAGRVRADFGAVGSIDLRFHRLGPARKVNLLKECDGKVPLEESGRWVGRVSLRGEGGFFAVSAGSAPGAIDRVFRLACPAKHPLPPPEHKSLRDQVEPDIGASLISVLVGTVSSLEAVESEGGRVVALRAAHASGTGPGAEVEAGEFEYQGQMPVGGPSRSSGPGPGLWSPRCPVKAPRPRR